MPTLTVESGALAGQTYSFEDSAVLGRGQLANVRVDDVTISRRHAEVRPAQGGGWEIADLGSANGTRVNGEPLAPDAPRRLADGDHVVLGQVEMVVRLPAPAAATTDPSALQGTRPAAGGALFQDVLARIKLFCDLGALGGMPLSPEAQMDAALKCVMRAFPHLDRAMVLLYVAAGDQFTLHGVAARSSHTLNTAALAPIVREALRHEHGLLATTEAERESLSQRLRIFSPHGALAAIPIRIAGEVVGVIYADSDKDPDAMRAGDRDTLVAVAGILGCLMAPHRAPKRDAEAESHDLTLARRIQQRFLPQAPPALNGYVFVDSYTAARVIGGDHYDFLTLGDGRHVVVIADVSGKAISGALYMARLGAVLKQAAGRVRRAGELLEDINRVLYAELEAGMFVTMLVFVLEPRTGTAELASAGHPSPLVRRRGGKIEQLEVAAGPPLGAMSEPSYDAARCTLASGDTMLLYTDGLDEAHNPESKLFGLDRVKEAMARADGAQQMVKLLLEDLGRFVGSEPQSDDLTIVAIQRN